MLSKLVKLLPKNEIADECSDSKGLLMIRYYLTPKIFGFRLVIHQFHRSDNDRHYHDHPWNFISIILKGNYVEHYPSIYQGTDIQHAHRRWDIIKRPKEWKHWVELVDQMCDCGSANCIYAKPVPCWTLVLLYGKRRDWGFWTEQGWVKYDKYDCRGDYVGNNPVQENRKSD